MEFNRRQSAHGWKLYGKVPLHAGDVCSMKVRFASRIWVAISVAIVRWTRGIESGIETFVMNHETVEQLNTDIQARTKTL